MCVCVCDEEERTKRWKRRASLLCVDDDLVQPLEHMASEAGVIAIASRQFPLLFFFPAGRDEWLIFAETDRACE